MIAIKVLLSFKVASAENCVLNPTNKSILHQNV